MAGKQPNFIVIMTDDQGYGDLSCMGNTDFCTPNIDALAANGARLQIGTLTVRSVLLRALLCNRQISGACRGPCDSGRQS